MKKVIAIALFLIMIICVCACDRDESTVTLDIPISYDEGVVEYSDAAKAELRDAIYNLLTDYAHTYSEYIPDATSATLRRHANAIGDIVCGVALPVDAFESLPRAIANIDVTATDGSMLSKVFDELSPVISTAKAGEILHGVIGYYYDYRIEVQTARYQQYGYSYMQREILQLQNEKATLTNAVSADDLSALLRTLSIATSLKKSIDGGLDTDAVSDAEIVMLLRMQDCVEIELNADAWLILLRLFGSTLPNGYLRDIVTAADKNGDLVTLSTLLNDVITLVRYARDTVDESDVGSIRAGASPISVVASRLGDDQWTIIDRISKGGWHNDDYNSIATDRYGDDFVQYQSKLTEYTLSDLRAALTDDQDPDDAVQRYLSSVCPALAYEVFK